MRTNSALTQAIVDSMNATREAFKAIRDGASFGTVQHLIETAETRLVGLEIAAIDAAHQPVAANDPSNSMTAI
jgi:hypothetical protein